MKLILNPANRRGFAFLGEAMQQPYFFNPGMTTQQLEDWLGQQNLSCPLQPSDSRKSRS
ncbi:hypothetical protein [Klebsiella pneumoniae]|uniref:hypothetical protein n=1 Tax=Klebsiella pneumoniae TaxID=573 RepID=UPI00396F678D